MNINELKNFNVRNVSTDSAIYAAEQVKLLAMGYENRKLAIPEWVADKMMELEAEIKLQVRAELSGLLRKLKASRAALSTPDEKRKRLDDQIEELTKSM